MTDLYALITELADELDHNRQCLLDDRRLTHPLADKARAVLARWGNHPGSPDSSTPQPMPAGERLQQVEDLAADAIGALRYIEQVHGRLYGVGWDRVYEKADRLLPAHALPVPSHD